MKNEIVVVLAVSLAACGSEPPPPAKPPAPPAAPTHRAAPPVAAVETVPATPAPSWNGAHIGDTVRRFLDAGLEASLCDTDPIQHGERRIWFFAPCRSAAALPGGGVLTLLGDVLNVVYLDRKLKSAVA